MKNIIIILLTLLPFVSYGQTDSSSVKINLNMQARDAEYVASFVSHREEYEDLFDAIKLKFRVANAPANTTNVAVDSIEIKTWLLVANVLRKDHISLQAGIFTRIDALLRAKNNPYLTRVLNEAIAADTKVYLDSRAFGRKRLRKQP